MKTLKDKVLKEGCFEYPLVPRPMSFIAEDYGTSEIPRISGVYFVWHQTEVVYVGKSGNLKSRLTRSHQAIKEIQGEIPVSWIVFSKHELDYAECFYIGALRPSMNFSRNRQINNPSVKKPFRPIVPLSVLKLIGDMEDKLAMAEAEYQASIQKDAGSE